APATHQGSARLTAAADHGKSCCNPRPMLTLASSIYARARSCASTPARKVERNEPPHRDIAHFCLTLVRETPDAVIFADAEGVIRFWNRGAERIFGFAEAEAVGESLDIIIPGNLRARHWAGFTATMHSGRTRYGAGDTLARYSLPWCENRLIAPAKPTVSSGRLETPIAKPYLRHL